MPFSPLPRRRTIATLYDLIPLLDPVVRRGMRVHRRKLHAAYLRLVQSAGLVIAISEQTASQASLALDVDPTALRVVYPAVGSIARIRSSSGNGQLSLLFVGVPEPHKRPELAIAALAVLRQGGLNISLRFVGPMPGKAVASLREIAGRAGVEEDVEFLGRLSESALTALYPRSVLLAVSRLEGFGLPPVEALLSGGRVVAVDNQIYRETLGGAATFATVDTPLAIAEAISIAMKAPTNAAAIADLQRRYSPRATMKALRDAYMAILER
jgi:glycosyltransferase involved in cell wall biosynthesis